METIAFLLLAMFIGIAILVNAFYRRAKQQGEERSYVVPKLGFQEGTEEPLLPLFEHLEASIDSTYLEQLRDRVMKEHRITQIDWENRWFEWQRFLVMVALLDNVPMYSREVDEIWHEMLMFTREYEQFSQNYLKTTLHHAPNIMTGEAFNRHERATFDWFYVTLFKPTVYSHRSWGKFLQHPLDPEEIKRLKEQSLEPILHHRVADQVPVVKKAQTWLAAHIKEQILQIEQHVEEQGDDLNLYVKHFILPIARDHAGLAMLRMDLFLSLYYHDQFDEKREKLFKQVGKELRKQKKPTKKEKAS
ncbi:hypothetical protein SAMN05444392_11462 [Seinonella peptonophila]|uniref:Uncharacterized protein n=1 Tax=Seinonella peptonophila TaxID=112248 RepID=A0A1M5AKE6_9BACL|nr:hypothetical protein [Seinonella peptonophila]SHF30693.1 hypothetical protein SAMN05444392_11462 [Seinonella peptonophila]